MANNDTTVRRVLLMRVRALGDASQLLTMMKTATPFYQALGGTRFRFLHNVDDPAQFVVEVDYEANAAMELNRHSIAGDHMVRTFLQGWRTFLQGAAEFDVYEDVTKS
jgi:hypothetical protein